jgi:nucleoside-diphosphate-sugar epimerase
MGTVNVLEAARVTGLRRVVVSSSSVLNHYLEGGADDGDFGKEEAFPRPTTFYSATSRRSKALASTTRGGAGSSSPGCARVPCLDPGAALAAGGLPTSCVRR